jgi:predicted acyl esterase
MGSRAGRGWNSALEWPPPEARNVSMYFQNYAANSIDSVNDGALDLEPPAGTQAWDEYTLFLYLEDVGPYGYSRYVTEGALRASHHALSEPPYELFGLPYHRSFAEDLLPLAGEPVELIFELLPTSHIFAAGHRLRFTLTGADADNALTPRLDPPPSIRVYTEAGRASYVAMPLILGE